jgi:outer membrane protein assembly factor BamB
VATGAPTALAGRVHVAGRDGTGWTVDAATGRILWSVRSTPDRLGVKGGAGPAATAETVVFPFISGELIAAEPRTGARPVDRLSPRRDGRGGAMRASPTSPATR